MGAAESYDARIPKKRKSGGPSGEENPKRIKPNQVKNFEAPGAKWTVDARGGHHVSFPANKEWQEDSRAIKPLSSAVDQHRAWKQARLKTEEDLADQVLQAKEARILKMMQAYKKIALPKTPRCQGLIEWVQDTKDAGQKTGVFAEAATRLYPADPAPSAEEARGRLRGRLAHEPSKTGERRIEVYRVLSDAWRCFHLPLMAKEQAEQISKILERMVLLERTKRADYYSDLIELLMVVTLASPKPVSFLANLVRKGGERFHKLYPEISSDRNVNVARLLLAQLPDLPGEVSDLIIAYNGKSALLTALARVPIKITSSEHPGVSHPTAAAVWYREHRSRNVRKPRSPTFAVRIDQVTLFNTPDLKFGPERVAFTFWNNDLTAFSYESLDEHSLQISFNLEEWHNSIRGYFDRLHGLPTLSKVFYRSPVLRPFSRVFARLIGARMVPLSLETAILRSIASFLR